MNGPAVTYCGTASDDRSIRVLLHGAVHRLTLDEWDALVAAGTGPAAEARVHRAETAVARATATTLATVTRLYGPRP